MLTEERIKELINKETIQDVESLELIEQYIYDMKGKSVRINRPIDFPRILLMNNAYQSAVLYYFDKFKTKEDEFKN